MKYFYKTRESLFRWFLNNQTVFNKLQKIGQIDMNKLHSIFQKKSRNYYGFAVEIPTSEKDHVTIEYYNIKNCNFIIAYDNSFGYDTLAQWYGNVFDEVNSKFLMMFLSDIWNVYDTKITGDTVIKVKMLSYKYEKCIPVEFWSDALLLENKDFGMFLVENLFNKL